MSYEDLKGPIAPGPGWPERLREIIHLYRTPEEQEPLIALRDRVFCPKGGYIGRGHDRIFSDDSWTRVIIRGSLHGSDRSEPPDDCYSDMEDWRNDDPRDELMPLLQAIYDDGVEEIIHMPVWFNEYLAMGAPVNLDGLRCFPQLDEPGGHLVTDTERLIFDRTARWGIYASCEQFGLLGGEPDFMARYLEKAGGWEFIRQKADAFWQDVTEVESHHERDMVDHYYKLAGWDNPPQRTDT